MTEKAGTLAGIKVVDLSRVLGGPYCAQILGDHGADVIKVEPPSGDETRSWGPPFEDGTAAYFIGINRNKRGVVLDLASDDGQRALFGFLEGADVLVENFKTGTLECGVLAAKSSANVFRASCIAAYPASAPEARLAACRATTRPYKQCRDL